jgi:hypothetical protein
MHFRNLDAICACGAVCMQVVVFWLFFYTWVCCMATLPYPVAGTPTKFHQEHYVSGSSNLVVVSDANVVVTGQHCVNA